MTEVVTESPIIQAEDVPDFAERSQTAGHLVASLGGGALLGEGFIDVADVPDFTVEEPIPQAPPRYIIDHVPQDEEFALGYEGQEGEYKDANRLLASIDVIDPDREFTTEESRKEKLLSMEVHDMKTMITTIHSALYPDGKQDFSDREMLLSGGTGDDKKVGTIGIGPEDREELFEDLLEGMKVLVQKGDLYNAGRMAAQTLVVMQPFEDGNKRTARAFYELVAYGFDGSHYDVHGIRERLAYTHSARNSMYYVGITSNLREPYIMEDMAPVDRKNYMNLSGAMFSLASRPKLSGALAHLGDQKLIDQVVNTLQQGGFGAQYIFENTDPSTFQKYNETYDKSLFEKAVEDYCSSMTAESAQAFLARDRDNRKQSLKRLIKASTGENPLPHYSRSDGLPYKGMKASLAA